MTGQAPRFDQHSIPARNPDAIRAVLPPDSRARFDQESRQAMAEAVEHASIEPVQLFLTRWQGIAALHCNPELKSHVCAEADRLLGPDWRPMQDTGA